jgi:hypothetical protein
MGLAYHGRMAASRMGYTSRIGDPEVKALPVETRVAGRAEPLADWIEHADKDRNPDTS